ncbi:MAG: hypothetical protein DCF13_13660, partial [Flavobacteriaceae bacterium]
MVFCLKIKWKPLKPNYKHNLLKGMSCKVRYWRILIRYKMNYDFSTLSSKEFEILSCDLLNAKFNETKKYGEFRNFKEGKDKGIDLLYSTQNNNYKVVVQIKHYIKSSFSNLKRDLIKNEKTKVKLLNPESYFFITSQELSVENKKNIQEIFNPFILSIDDIYGQEDLNALLRKYPIVEEK